ncbi:Glucan 1,3-beta-glucosidase A [Wallemia ichthyophaga EXF-994]|uniref:Glucan 1,3-beta-glucosidase A n=1 Tax=Wallemia ichthyophaga (strain EXF-994 / CBS 113033) TaxID=1299270 RepID=R9AEZ4_WALI9|nr:Glucan 1,3-beta-glucosidase A [Wallemia ichthyophaga EXF-994]EOR00710.1 Glucan 1,3-beta-glucosidase A [Wallemia ichthyophaga EXF-994]
MLVKLLCLALLSIAAAGPLQRRHGEQIRGVNIGGFLVLEAWITPSIFDNTGNPDIVDEWTFGEYQDSDQAEAVINSHLDTFYTYSDFQDIKNAGLTHVRIPIGFWAFETLDTPYIKGNRYAKLQEVVGWCRDIGLKVWIDLHGAPGSQNGQDNSGHLMDYFLWPTDQSNIEKSYYYIQILTDEFTKPEYGGIVDAIELMNEPQVAARPSMYDTVKTYFQNGYNIVSPKTATAIAGGFIELDSWNDFLTYPGAENVYMDTHKYQIFSNQQIHQTDQQRLDSICAFKQTFAEHTANQHWVICGEWTLAFTDCAKYINGRGNGSRYDGSQPGSTAVGSCEGKSGNGDNWSEDYKNRLRYMWYTQIDTFENGGRGYFFWTWKNEDAADWSYKRLLELGVISYDPNDYQHGICG